MIYKNLLELVQYLELFENEKVDQPFRIEDFSYWLMEKVSSKPRSLEDMASYEKDSIAMQPPDVQISILIGRMSKYARVYAKKILSHTKLSGLDDYAFMATLMFRESMTKTGLTHYNLMDSITSGADIIKRLLKENYIEEFDDPIDKRSKRVRITTQGKAVMFQVFSEMEIVSAITTGNLDNNEKLHLLGSLKKLDHLHKNIYDDDRKEELQTIKNKYIRNLNNT
ncbi:MAG TPA: hypothetical protein DCQ26_13670 [Marinilabiliales bacterium]|nr:MAG: hypothetical protein A2W95_18770 [Bacteroidetes bacterium GWA2_40_14]OFX60822.1 MAG: hypothetical protein A2W84_14960 [Bacteroidetes bacterium GWC2_40_13]OFX71448.1 MAG: hypothetical protein A2W96_13085 [Bacteroidetes bacterium GWD2_40_43]OFX92697.1 MAG: hypothetical protein A2W97_08830 [Bacteroidetes bacterium GWE2_40_63]OFY17602.1 MAG: hypothetical protein A2W88_10910 [Bacteroidetes bacterium GWF2_40_13]OFZ28055.1 MAG: hypothetical protein A2437_04085 [Bacteroidetes bacterium RIFOXYC